MQRAKSKLSVMQKVKVDASLVTKTKSNLSVTQRAKVKCINDAESKNASVMQKVMVIESLM